MLRRLGVYSVACYENQFNALCAAGALEQQPDFPDGSAILTDLSQYDRSTGQNTNVTAGEAIFF